MNIYLTLNLLIRYYLLFMAHKKKSNGIKKYIIRILIALAVIGVTAILALGAFFYYLSFDLPPVGPLSEGYDPPQTTKIVADDGTIIGEMFIERRTVVPVKKIPDILKNAVVSAEDADFWHHSGIDYMGIVRASLRNIMTGHFSQGASTITQQVARTFFLTREKSIKRKIKEMMLTHIIEQELSKDNIIFLYLNQINFGHARYGVKEACLYYFDKDIKDINLQEAALLAGIPKGPSIYEPIGHPKKAKSRRSYVLSMMEKNGYISHARGALAKESPLGLKTSSHNRVHYVPEAVSMVLNELKNIIDEKTLKHGGYTITTSLNMNLQKESRNALVKGLIKIDSRHTRIAPFVKRRWPKGNRGKGSLSLEKVYVAEVTGSDDQKGIIKLKLGERDAIVDISKEKRYNPKNLKASQMAEVGAKLKVRLNGSTSLNPLKLKLAIGPQGASVVIDVASGYILSIIGGDKAEPGGFNRAVSSVRQPGSAFKPFVYLEAIRSRKFSPSTLLDDSPEVDGDWKPENSHGSELKGRVSMRDALALSLNLPAIKLIRATGPENVAKLARALGIHTKLDPVPSLALGSSGVTPVDMAAAYATLANYGIKKGPWIVKRIHKEGERDIPLVGRIGKPVIAREDAYLITSMLKSVIEKGTGKKAKSLKIPLAGKTGTTNDAKDAWFVGYSPLISTAVWVGYDEPRTLGKREYGAKAALPIWINIMRAAHKGRKINDFIMPAGVEKVLIDPESGLLPYEGMENSVEELFIEGTAPTEHTLPPDVVSLENFMVEQADETDTDSGHDKDTAVLNSNDSENSGAE